MRLESALPGEQCRHCGARMFLFRTPDRYICLRQIEHARYLTGNIPGRNGTRVRHESDLHTQDAHLYLRDAARSCGDGLDLP